MKRKYIKLASIVLLIGTMTCVLAYGDKEGKASLPDVLSTVINELYPLSVLEETNAEEEGIKVYEVKLNQNGQELEITLAPDGTLVETEAVVDMADIPDAVKTAITEAAGGAEVKEISKEITYAVTKLVVLDQPQTTYETQVVIDGQQVEIKLATDGTIISSEVEDDDDEDNDDDDEDDEDDDEDEDEDDDD